MRNVQHFSFKVSMAAMMLSIVPILLNASDAKEDSLKVWSQHAWRLRGSNPDSSFYYASKALEASTTLGNKKIKAYSLSDLAGYYMLKGNYAMADSLLRKSQAIRIELGNAKDIASGYNNIGRLFNFKENYDSAIIYLNQGLEIARNHEFLDIQGSISNVLAVSMMDKHAFDQAEQLLLKSITIAQQLGDSTSLAARHQNLSRLYFQVNRTDLALEYLKKASKTYESEQNIQGQTDLLVNEAAIWLKKGDVETAIYQYKKAAKLSEEHGLLDNMESIYNNLGCAYELIQDYKSAEAFLIKGVSLSIANNRPHSIVELSLNLARVHILQEDFDGALAITEDLDSIIRKYTITRYLSEYYIIRAKAFAGLENYEEALSAQIKADNIKDSLNLIVDNAQVSLEQMERLKRDEIILKERNQLQAARLDQQEVEAQNRNLVLASLLLLLLSISGFLLMRNRTIRLKMKALAEKKKSDEKVKELLAGINQQMLETQIEAYNETSFKIGQNLHDNLGSKLAVVQSSVEGIRKKVNSTDEDVQQRFERVEELMEQSCNDLRTIAHDLQDRERKQLSLEMEIERYTELINSSAAIRVHLNKEEMPDSIQPAVQKEIISVARLLIENVIRHAQASVVNLDIRTANKHLMLTVSDDGVGFDPLNPKHQTGRGLKNAEERAKRLGGEFTLLSRAGLGTKATLRIPFTKL